MINFISFYFILMLSTVYASPFNTTYFESTTPGTAFVVPLGVFSINILAEGYNNGFAASLSVSVEPNDLIHIVVGSESTLCGGESSSVKVNDNLILLAAGGNYELTGNDFSLTNLNSGEGLYGECGGLSYHGNTATNVVVETTIGLARVMIRWEADCTEGYGLLSSDFNPTLLGTSSLYIRDGTAVLALDIGIPMYYYDVTFDFKSACNGMIPNVEVSTHGCINHFSTTIDYLQYCQFDYEPSETDPDIYVYLGEIQINATLEVSIGQWNVERQLSSPIRWQVQLQRTISVSADLQVVNDDVCSSDADCNNNGCCTQGQCDCQCVDKHNGFQGKYCHIDITPPQVDIESQEITIYSPRGGCMQLKATNQLMSVPSFVDNEGILSVMRTVTKINEASVTMDVTQNANDDLLSVCFNLGSGHTVIYYAEDLSGNSKTIEITINVLDTSVPVLDCAGCQTAYPNDQLIICDGTTDASNPFTPLLINKTELAQHMTNDHISGRFACVLPGQMIDMTLQYGNDNLVLANEAYANVNVYLDCNCVVHHTVQPEYKVVTNSWGSWGAIRALDPSDLSLEVSSSVFTVYTVGGIDGEFIVTYSALDDSGNSGSCDLHVLYDTTPPSCSGWFQTVSVDKANSNYTEPIFFTQPQLYADISGLKELTFEPVREQGDIYYIGYETSLNYTSVYSVMDNAGNINTCEWKLHIVNPNPCIWPTCNINDLPPFVDYCPSDITLLCIDANSCDGCGGWDEPRFGDDKGIISLVQSHTSHDSLSLGSTNVTYIATDITGQQAVCSFNVIISDISAPVLSGCPTDVLLGTGTDDFVEYMYSFSASDECTLNEYVMFSTVDFPLDISLVNGQPNGMELLSIGSHGFTYLAIDDSGNIATCSWTVKVVDDVAPIIECPADIDTRILFASYPFVVVDFSADGTDNVDESLRFHYSKQPGSEFQEGIHEITVTAYDSANNTDSCIFFVTVLPSYGNPSMDAVLTKVSVKELSPGIFGAQLQFITLISPYFRLINPVSKVTDALANPKEVTANCPTVELDCFQTWSVTVSFDGCELTEGVYSFGFESLCQPGDCVVDSEEFDVTIVLSASNYCWQDLANVEVTATLFTTSKAVHDSFLTSVDAGLDPELGGEEYPGVNAFYNGQDISGIIEVVSDQVYTSNIKILDATKEFFSDADFKQSLGSTRLIMSSIDGDGVSSSQRAALATFSYTESEIPLEGLYYVRYEAVVEVSYQLGVSRRLLSFSTQDKSGRNLLQSNTDDTQNEHTVSVGFLVPDDAIDGTEALDGVFVISLESCRTDIDKFMDVVAHAIATHLRVKTERIVLKSYEMEDRCILVVIIKYLDCSGLMYIGDLINIMHHGVTNPTSDFHDVINEIGVTPKVVVDHTVFYVLQNPPLSSAPSNEEISQNQNKYGKMWMFAGGTGLVIGMICCGLFQLTKNNRKYTDPSRYSQIPQIMKNGRRLSVSEQRLITSSRRSSIITNDKSSSRRASVSTTSDNNRSKRASIGGNSGSRRASVSVAQEEKKRLVGRRLSLALPDKIATSRPESKVGSRAGSRRVSISFPSIEAAAAFHSKNGDLAPMFNMLVKQDNNFDQQDGSVFIQEI